MHKKLSFLTLFILVLTGCSLSGQTNIPKEQRNADNNKPIEQRNDTTSTEELVEKTSQGKVVSVDETWNRYINEMYGFSILVPKMMARPDGGCNPATQDDTDGYKLSSALVPIKILEQENNIIITSAYYYTTGGNDMACNKVENTNQLFTGKTLYESNMWYITVADASGDADIEQYIRQRYGEACGLGSKTFEPQKNFYYVKPKGDGKEPPESACWLNFMTHIVYSQEKHKVIGWDLGQAFSFYADINTNPVQVYDTKMVDSFKFE